VTEDDLALLCRQARELDALRREQLERDGRIWDALLRRWVLRRESAKEAA